MNIEKDIPMTQPCLEIVTYHSAADCDAERRRAEAVALAQSLRGFAGWLPLSGASDARADIVVWAGEEAARAAGQIVGAAPQFAPFRDSIATFGSMGHFDLPCGALPLMQAGEGVELGRFRLREGVTEAALKAAHAAMIAAHLSGQSGWRGQRLLRLQDGTYLDLAFAQSQELAQAICESWANSPECAAFLALIEPISMEFGAIL